MIDTKYNHQNVEQNKYNKWKDNNYFKSGDLSKKPFTIVIPPPNITGKLHLGHAWDTTLQDIIIRYKRMCGYDALWLPGMDHAGIATQAKIDKKLKDQGINPRELSREEWLKTAWDWKEEYASSIHEQWATLGLSLDYSKERFTLDENLSNAVKHVFITLYNKNYIYRGERIINWDPLAMTALSNEEVIYKDIEGAFYHLKYQLEDSNDYLEIATTRPETLFGDTAVAVNPNDDRYKKLIGKKVILPIVNKLIPIIADEYADPSFGTGVVKITPAHDPNDFEVGIRHQLDRVQVMNADGTMNDKAGKYQGLDRFECRKLLVEELKKQNLLLKINKIKHNVGHSERTDTMIEPYLSKQWFVNMCTLSKQVLDIQKTNNKVNFVPKRFEKILIHWMENCHDWCISRQLWWGHRIPAWYKGDEVFVGENSPGEGWIQDNDVLDTWFSSALWPFSTLGWPQETDDYKRYYPTNCLVTGYDIIFFWVCRMIFQGLEFTKQVPFNDVLIHGLIRDKDGRKMSKSLGNGINPMEIIEKYGCDSLRYYLATTVSAGMDLRFEEEKIKSTWNFINKLWNASRFVFMNTVDIELKPLDKKEFSISDKWILTKLNKTIKSVTKHMEKYEFNLVGKILYNFIWDDFCDWYIELSKIDMNNTTKNVLIHVLSQILKMLHPFMPFVTEEIYLMLPNSDESIMISSYPIYNKEHIFDNHQEQESVIELIKKIRKIKTDNNINDFTMVCSCNLVNNNKECFIKMTKANLVDSDDNLKDLEKIGIEIGSQKIDIFYDNTDNKEKEIANFKILKEKLIESINRRKKLLSNKSYVEKAPKQIVEKDKEMLYKEEQELKNILEKIS